MLVYILAEEPYHDNGWIVGVYLELDKALDQLKTIPDPLDINANDFLLTEWDTETDKSLRTWEMRGNQVSEFGSVPWSESPQNRPTHVEFTLIGPLDS